MPTAPLLTLAQTFQLFMQSKTYWVQQLQMTPHPEGGYFKEVYRSEDTLAQSALPARYAGARSCATSIYFLIESENFSAFHRIQSDEIWHFYTGSTIRMHIIHPDGKLETHLIGPNFDQGEVFQLVIPHSCWFAASVDAQDAYALVGCGVAPGFDFVDFELGTAAQLVADFPQHAEVIGRYTRL